MIRHFSLLLGIAIATASVADAQLTRAYVSGVVADSSGGVIAGVKVRITARDTGVTRALSRFTRRSSMRQSWRATSGRLPGKSRTRF